MANEQVTKELFKVGATLFDGTGTEKTVSRNLVNGHIAVEGSDLEYEIITLKSSGMPHARGINSSRVLFPDTPEERAEATLNRKHSKALGLLKAEISRLDIIIQLSEREPDAFFEEASRIETLNGARERFEKLQDQ